MAGPGDDLPRLHFEFSPEEWSQASVKPWFTFRVNLPVAPLPGLSERTMLTERLVIRALQASDLDAFWDLRRQPETQYFSVSRGRADADRTETKACLERLYTEPESHWYFGAFLASNGELIGECGLPDVINTPTGWPCAEFLIKPEYRRQGYGTELWKPVMESWWMLPREVQRHQLFPDIAGDKEPGDHIPEGVILAWEAPNKGAESFLRRMMEQEGLPMRVTSTLETVDLRQGRDRAALTVSSFLAENPNDTSFGQRDTT